MGIPEKYHLFNGGMNGENGSKRRDFWVPYFWVPYFWLNPWDMATYESE